MGSTHRRKQAIPSRFANAPKRVHSDAEYVVELSPEERQDLKRWVHGYLEHTPVRERELLIDGVPNPQMREILQRMRPGAQDPKYVKIWYQ